MSKPLTMPSGSLFLVRQTIVVTHKRESYGMVKNSYSYFGVVAVLEVHSSHLLLKGTLRQRMLLADTFGIHCAVHAKAVLARVLLVNDRGHWEELEVGHFCPVQDSSMGNGL